MSLHMSLGYYGGSNCANKIIQILVQCLRDDDPCARRLAAEGLGRLGPDGILHLRKAVKDGIDNVRTDAERVLQIIEKAVPHLENAAKDEDGAVRKASTSALHRIQPEAA